MMKGSEMADAAGTEVYGLTYMALGDLHIEIFATRAARKRAMQELAGRRCETYELEVRS
jgi:hypothetical protein